MRPIVRGARVAACVTFALALAGCTLGGSPPDPTQGETSTKAQPPSPSVSSCERPTDPIEGSVKELNLVPAPTAATTREGGDFTLTDATAIEVAGPVADFGAPARYVSELLAPATGWKLAVREVPSADTNVIRFCPLTDGKAEHYELYSSKDAVVIFAADQAAAFAAVATLRQLLPTQVESSKPTDATWAVPAVAIKDAPRYHYRGMMLDVARSFFVPDDVKKVIDTMALYKLNQLHLHLSDDQGWRIAIDGYPKLTEVGASYQSGHPKPSGPFFYSQDDFKDLVAYAASRGISIIPELDGPSHVNAAQTAYGNLTCTGKATQPYTGHDVGFSLYCLEGSGHIATTDKFLSSVWEQVAALTPGPYLHFGGDEAMKSTPTTYGRYVDIVDRIARDNDKKAMGWAQIGAGKLSKGSVMQYWGTAMDSRSIGGAESVHITQVRSGLAQGAKVVMSPADRAYIDQCYDSSTPVGTNWAGCIEPKDAYNWNPALYLSSGTAASAVVPAKSILGVEACLFADHLYRGWPAAGATKDFLTPMEYFGYMALPRLSALAEVAWTAQDDRDYGDFKTRARTHEARWKAAGLDYNDSDSIW